MTEELVGTTATGAGDEAEDEHRDRPPVVVFGAGRSGTTWLAQIIAAAGLELIFEPLNEKEVPEATEFRRRVRLLDATDTSADWDDLFTRALQGELRNAWTLRAGTHGERKVVKLIRANLIIEWMMSRFELLPVFIIRNPLAVVDSLRTEDWGIPETWVHWIVSDARLRRRLLPPLDDILDHTLSTTEISALYWCIQNVVPLRQGLLSSIPLVRFEELCSNPDGVMASLAPRIGIEVTDPVRAAYERWSVMKGKRAGRAGYDPTSAWRSSLSPSEVDVVARIVSRFGLQQYLEL